MAAFAQLAGFSNIPKVTAAMVPMWSAEMSNRMAAQFRIISQEISKTKATYLSSHRSAVWGGCDSFRGGVVAVVMEQCDGKS